MDITFEKSDLAYSLGILQGVSVKNEAMPILSNLMIEASVENGIYFTGNNLECGVKTKVEGTVNEEGMITVNSKKLLDMVKELPKGDINIQVSKNHRLKISSGKGKFTIIGQSADEFPRIPEITSEQTLTVDALSLNMAIQKVSFAAHSDASNTLNSIHFRFLDDRTEVVATKRSVLSMATLPPLERSLEENDLLIPMQAIKEINRVFSNSDEISTFVTEALLLFTDGTSILTSRIIEKDEYPNYERLIASHQSGEIKSITAMKDLTINTLKRVLVLANPQDYSVKLSFQEDSLQMSSNGPDIGNAEDFSEIIGEGFEDSISIDGDTLLAALSRVGTETLDIEMVDKTKPLIIKSTSTDIDNMHVSLIMPMQVSGQ